MLPKSRLPGWGVSPQSSFLGAAGRGAVGSRATGDNKPTPPPCSPHPSPRNLGGRLSPEASTGAPPLPGRGQLTSGAGSLGPSPGTVSSLCGDPPTCTAGGRHSFGSVPRAIHCRLSSRRPTLAKEA